MREVKIPYVTNLTSVFPDKSIQNAKSSTAMQTRCTKGDPTMLLSRNTLEFVT